MFEVAKESGVEKIVFGERVLEVLVGQRNEGGDAEDLNVEYLQ
jgi:hypothetical protein